jgi:hypothetical protein
MTSMEFDWEAETLGVPVQHRSAREVSCGRVAQRKSRQAPSRVRLSAESRYRRGSGASLAPGFGHRRTHQVSQ